MEIPALRDQQCAGAAAALSAAASTAVDVGLDGFLFPHRRAQRRRRAGRHVADAGGISGDDRNYRAEIANAKPVSSFITTRSRSSPSCIAPRRRRKRSGATGKNYCVVYQHDGAVLPSCRDMKAMQSGSCRSPTRAAPAAGKVADSSDNWLDGADRPAGRGEQTSGEKSRILGKRLHHHRRPRNLQRKWNATAISVSNRLMCFNGSGRCARSTSCRASADRTERHSPFTDRERHGSSAQRQPAASGGLARRFFERGYPLDAARIYLLNDKTTADCGESALSAGPRSRCRKRSAAMTGAPSCAVADRNGPRRLLTPIRIRRWRGAYWRHATARSPARSQRRKRCHAGAREPDADRPTIARGDCMAMPSVAWCENVTHLLCEVDDHAFLINQWRKRRALRAICRYAREPL